MLTSQGGSEPSLLSLPRLASHSGDAAAGAGRWQAGGSGKDQCRTQWSRSELVTTLVTEQRTGWHASFAQRGSRAFSAVSADSCRPGQAGGGPDDGTSAVSRGLGLGLGWACVAVG
ncbi:hypothetical protein GGTG_08107 [Gaeumannomyces tritici R3-111a-1]|uniref:Uncharacterized protein n=1 Tax=Gaeumannomyces tritici (strain R3-111a-1) TaxID=644352 RepID=J3P3M0_GAET3|nr:hypothetical protein GGTG_08107 [Gaeumannomyces tritici R3-111a-1]EJT74264.1 hypothetical protein GGTG_08107 [Gaeumannomyces tritici R3-111a-1]